MTRQIVLDTETTGLNPKQGHRIIEIGCIELQKREITGNNLHLYINPERDIDEGAVKVHGITTEFLADKPLFTDIIQQFIQFIDGAELIIHNAPFDVGFLNHEMQLAGIKQYGQIADYCEVIDTLVMARNKHPGQRNSLDALCQRYDVDNSNRDLHGALLDSELLAGVYLRMTGGQTQLFSFDETPHQQTVEHKIKRVQSSRPPLKIITASQAEQQAHQNYCQQMQDKGECLWLSDS